MIPAATAARPIQCLTKCVPGSLDWTERSASVEGPALEGHGSGCAAGQLHRAAHQQGRAQTRRAPLIQGINRTHRRHTQCRACHARHVDQGVGRGRPVATPNCPFRLPRCNGRFQGATAARQAKLVASKRLKSMAAHQRLGERLLLLGGTDSVSGRDGQVHPLGTAIALPPFGQKAGAASALLGFMQMGCAALPWSYLYAGCARLFGLLYRPGGQLALSPLVFWRSAGL